MNYTVQLLYKAVKKASISPHKLMGGDLIIVTGATADEVGIVDNLQESDDTDVEIALHTATGLKTLKVSDKNFIHLIKRADMLNLRERTDYERDLKDMTKGKGHVERPEHSPVSDSDKSALPTSKISLNLRRDKKDN